MERELKLANLNVAIFESRLAKTMADLVALQGGTPFSAPSMKEVPLENNQDAFHFAERLFKGQVDVIILLTGVGTRALVSILSTRYRKEDIVAAFRKTVVVPRGPKPVKVLNELEISFAVKVPGPNTWREILAALDQNKDKIPVANRVVAVQEYGVTNPELLTGLKDRGAEVLRVPVYRWALPDDLGPLRHTISNIVTGKIDMAMFTTAVQVDHVFQVAKEMGVAEKLRDAFQKVVVASIGPDCSEAIRSHGLSVDFEPKGSKMGPFVTETAAHVRAILDKKRNQKDCATDVRLAVLGVAKEDELQNSALMKACRREKTPCTPIWLMRQAGRYMKDYRLIRDRLSFLEICKNRDLVTEITVTAQKKIKADAAIIFSDILLILECFNLGLDYPKGDGPSIQRVIRNARDIEKLPDVEPREVLSYVFQAIRQTRSALDPGIPLIGFAGAPFTLASYMIEGGASKDFKETKRLMLAEEGVWRTLMGKLVKATVKYLNGQIKAGAQVVQLFDSWVGCLKSGEYEKYVFPYSSQVIQEIPAGTPVIHFGTGTSGFLELFSKAGGDVIGVDHKVGLGEAWKRIGLHKAIQGNLDPAVLCSDLQEIRTHVKRILHEADGRAGHIFNLGHGVLPETPEENVIALVDMVHELSRR